MRRVKGTNKTVTMVNVLMTSFISCDDIYGKDYGQKNVEVIPGQVGRERTLNE